MTTGCFQVGLQLAIYSCGRFLVDRFVCFLRQTAGRGTRSRESFTTIAVPSHSGRSRCYPVRLISFLPVPLSLKLTWDPNSRVDSFLHLDTTLSDSTSFDPSSVSSNEPRLSFPSRLPCSKSSILPNFRNDLNPPPSNR